MEMMILNKEVEFRHYKDGLKEEGEKLYIGRYKTIANKIGSMKFYKLQYNKDKYDDLIIKLYGDAL